MHPQPCPCIEGRVTKSTAKLTCAQAQMTDASSVLSEVIRFQAILRHPPHLCVCRGASGFVQLAQNQETRERVAIKYVCMRHACASV
jgi:hypothetical protein